MRMKTLTDKEFGDYATMHAIHEGGNTNHAHQLKKEFAEFLVASGRAAQSSLMLDFHFGELEAGQIEVAKYRSLLEHTSRLRDEMQQFLDALFCGEFGSPKEQQLELALAGAYDELENLCSVKDNWEGAFNQLGKGTEALAAAAYKVAKMLQARSDAAAAAAAGGGDGDGGGAVASNDFGSGDVDQGDVAKIQKDMQTGYQHYANAWYYLPDVDLPELGDAHMHALQALTSHVFLDAQEKWTLSTTKAYLQDLRLRGEGAQAWVASMITGILEPAEGNARDEVDKSDALLKQERKALITARIVDEFGSCDPVEDAAPVRKPATRPGRASVVVAAGPGQQPGGGATFDAAAEIKQLKQQLAVDHVELVQNVNMDAKARTKIAAKIRETEMQIVTAQMAAATGTGAAGASSNASAPKFRHVDMNGRRFQYSDEENARIAAAWIAGHDFVQLNNVTLADGKTMQFCIKFGTSATSQNVTAPSPTGMLQVNLDTDWGRIVERGGVASNDTPADVAGSDTRTAETPASDAAIIGVKARFAGVYERLKEAQRRSDSAVQRKQLENEVAVLKAQLVAAESEKQREATKAREGALQLQALLNEEQLRAANDRAKLVHDSAAAAAAATAAAAEKVAQSESDATALVIQQQERAANEAKRLQRERTLQQARAKARLAQRGAARDLAAAQLATLNSELAALPTITADTAEDDQAKVSVAREGFLQRWNTLSVQMASMKAASSKADASLDNVSTGIVAEKEMHNSRVEHLRNQLASDRAQLAQSGSGKTLADPKLTPRLTALINAAEGELAMHEDAATTTSRWSSAVAATQSELKQALVDERSTQNALLMKLEEIKTKLAPPPPPPPPSLASSRSPTGISTGMAITNDDLTVVLIKHQEAQSNVAAGAAQSKAMQMAKAKARLAQRLLMRDEAAAKLAELEDEVENPPGVGTATPEGEAALIVWQETVSQHHEELLQQLISLTAGIAAAEVTAATATGLAGAGELLAMLDAERSTQTDLTAQMAALSAKLAASNAALDAAAAEQKAAADTSVDASIVMIKHQEQQQATQAQLAATKAGQQAKMRAKLADRKRARAQAAEQLAALAAAVDATAAEEMSRTEERTEERQAELEVMIEETNRRRNMLEDEMVELGTEAAASEVEASVAAGAGGGAADALLEDVAAERADQAALTAQLAELSSKLAGALAALSATSAAVDAAADAKSNAMDADAVLIKHAEAQDEVQAATALSRKAQQAKMQARLASRKTARAAAAAELVALQSTLDAATVATTLEDEMEQEVNAESVQKKRDALLKLLAELDAEQAMAEIEGSAPTITVTDASDAEKEADATFQRELEEEREKQKDLAAQLVSLNAKLNATQSELAKAKKKRQPLNIGLDNDSYALDASAIMIKHRENSDAADELVSSSRESQRAHINARFEKLRAKRERKKAAKVLDASNSLGGT